MAELVKQRRAATTDRLITLAADLEAAADLAAKRACVYATGSFARGEASPHSDLDLFIVGRGTNENRELPNLDEICLKADLIEMTRKFGIPEFSGDGEYLRHYTVDELVGKLG